MPTMPNDNDIELRSDEVQEVMNRIPPAIQRWGITLMAFIVTVFISITCLVKIPIIEETRFVINRVDSINRSTVRIVIPEAVVPKIIALDSIEARLYSDFFPDRFRSGIAIAVKPRQIISNHDGTYKAEIPLPSKLSIYLSEQQFEITGRSTLVITHKTLLESFGHTIQIDCCFF